MSLADDALSILAAGAKGAAAGGIAGPIGAAAGGVIGVAMDLLPGAAHWLGADEATTKKVVETVAAVTGTADPADQRTALAADRGMADDLRVQLSQIAAERRAEENRASEARQAAALADVASARTRDVQVRQASAGRNIRADLMLLAVTLSLLACIWAAATGRLGSDTAVFGLVSGIAGVLTGCFKDAFGFEFGSSRQSENKTEIIADMAKNTVPASMLPHPAEIVKPVK